MGKDCGSKPPWDLLNDTAGVDVAPMGGREGLLTVMLCTGFGGGGCYEGKW